MLHLENASIDLNTDIHSNDINMLFKTYNLGNVIIKETVPNKYRRTYHIKRKLSENLNIFLNEGYFKLHKEDKSITDECYKLIEKLFNISGITSINVSTNYVGLEIGKSYARDKDNIEDITILDIENLIEEYIDKNTDKREENNNE